MSDPEPDSNAAPAAGFTSRSSRIKRLLQASGGTKYLEIGVFRGATFRTLHGLERKVAVDPAFKFDQAAALQDPAVRLFEMTSDEFFAKEAASQGRYDLIFIDGLHHFAQSFRDFCACVSLIESGGMILIDDTFPQNPAQAHPRQRKAMGYKPLFGDTTRAWMGDVFKTVFAIHDYFPQFSLMTFPDHGQTLILPEPRRDFKPMFSSLEQIERLGFLEFVDLQPQVMPVFSYDEIFGKVDAFYAARRGLA